MVRVLSKLRIDQRCLGRTIGVIKQFSHVVLRKRPGIERLGQVSRAACGKILYRIVTGNIGWTTIMFSHMFQEFIFRSKRCKTRGALDWWLNCFCVVDTALHEFTINRIPDESNVRNGKIYWTKKAVPKTLLCNLLIVGPKFEELKFFHNVIRQFNGFPT